MIVEVQNGKKTQPELNVNDIKLMRRQTRRGKPENEERKQNKPRRDVPTYKV